MEFSVDKSSFYDNDLKELWDSDLEPAISEVFKSAADSDLADWGGLLHAATPSVILHDRLMTEASLGHPTVGATPIKAEHSYCSLGEDTDSTPDSELSLQARIDDMEDECYPCIPMKNATRTSRDSESSDASITVKDEPLSEPSSPESSCPMSPGSPAPVYQEHKTIAHTSTGSHPQSLLKQQTVLVSRSSVMQPQSRVSVLPKLNIKVESGFSLPPTPPSSTTSDCEGNDHHPVSPSNRQSTGNRLLVSPPPSTSTRQPIQTSLISSQPKGSTGMLILTEEEKRTLLAEGYPIPTRLPLTKAEEKSLKKIRRKIKNKISAQESRRKKKEYMDALERKVEILQSENSEYRKKIENLEDSNDSLVSQLNKLQTLVRAASSGNANAVAAAAAAAASFTSRNSVRHSDTLLHSSAAHTFTRSSVK